MPEHSRSKRAKLVDTPSQSTHLNNDSKITSKTGPFTYQLISKPKKDTSSRRGTMPTRHSIEITLSIPSIEDECPLTLDSIAESKLPCLPDTHFLPDRPLHSKLTLPCGHSFSAMTLIYSFCKNSMICPCCRAGEDIQADTCCLPHHFRSQLKAQIQETLETERQQDESNEHRDIMESFNIFGVTIPYEVLGANGNIRLIANFYNIPTGPGSVRDMMRPIFSFNNLVEPRRESNGNINMVLRGPLRTLSHVAHMGVNAIQLSIQLSLQGTGDIQIDSSPITRLPDVNDESAPLRLEIPGASGNSLTENGRFQVLVQLQRDSSTNSSNFVVNFSRTEIMRHLVLNNIMWRPETENLEIVSGNINLSAER